MRTLIASSIALMPVVAQASLGAAPAAGAAAKDLLDQTSSALFDELLSDMPQDEIQAAKEGSVEVFPCVGDIDAGCCLLKHPLFEKFPKGFWNDTKNFADNFHVRELLDSTPRMLERHYTFWNMMERTGLYNQEHRAVWLEECAFGTLTILLNALPAIEFEQGLIFAQHVFLHAVDLYGQFEQHQVTANWTIPAKPLYSTWPFLLGIRSSSCGETDVKVFVYEDLHGGYSDGSLFCSAGQWGIEVLLHRFFQTSDCRVADPNLADFFFVPDYRACHFHITPVEGNAKGITLGEDGIYSSLIRNHKQKSRHTKDADDIFTNLTKQLHHLDRRGGVDHIFVFSDQGFIVNFTHVFPNWQQHIPHSIFMTTEAETPGCGAECYSPWKDIVLPGHLDQERVDKIKSLNKPTEEREFIMAFHGRMGINHDYYKNITVRNTIAQMRYLPDVSIGGFVENYFEIIGNSHFCLIPVGTSSWTNHLYTAFFAGCIPVILSDKFVLPFADIIPWPSLTIRAAESDVSYIYDFLHSLMQSNFPRLRKMKKLLEEHQCWFEWYDPMNHCSPYRAVIKQLETRKASMPVHTLGSWAPPLLGMEGVQADHSGFL